MDVRDCKVTFTATSWNSFKRFTMRLPAEPYAGPSDPGRRVQRRRYSTPRESRSPETHLTRQSGANPADGKLPHCESAKLSEFFGRSSGDLEMANKMANKVE